MEKGDLQVPMGLVFGRDRWLSRI